MKKGIQIGLLVILLIFGGGLQGQAQTKTLRSIQHVKVTKRTVTGQTTGRATVKVLTNKGQVLGHNRANSKGKFKIKVKRDLRRTNFKFKISKKGYQTKTIPFNGVVDDVAQARKEVNRGLKKIKKLQKQLDANDAMIAEKRQELASLEDSESMGEADPNLKQAHQALNQAVQANAEAQQQLNLLKSKYEGMKLVLDSLQ
ncbi:hypothetical protein [Lactobacillus brevis] [Lactiplantibacillus mudanjiangensis]|uniref:Ig-like domain-containing protein n=1 Tax=Lactiplantibacillus mudanjiangensis TaxID=1296538 RepID=UPI001014994C|nr:Ig-like domain-containing protein [Lactiplantibacillus mudanjiangensis]VDG17510.1 hypothetical protein [Lactobacillus brevis] [Lactiplantibacillus mudanjiangensis]VDG32810.1 hypothetical protein [Lactobacillus brevis] [Lactiplantibacillus mudanjiangensis]